MKNYLILLLNLCFIEMSAVPSAGSVVTSFGINGSARLSFSSQVIVEDALVDTQGRILVTGSVTGSGGVIARFLPNGTLDTAFNSVGYAFFYYTDTNDGGTCIALYGNTIYVGGDNDGTSNGFIASFNDDGSLNNAWGVGGFFLLSNNANTVFSIAAQSDGKIIACGNLNNTDGYTARSNTSGTNFDTSFNATGTPGYQVLSNFVNATSCAVDSNGTLCVTSNNGTATLVYAFTEQGVLNTAFNATGVSSLINNFLANRLILQSSGAIVLAGSNAAASSALITRLTAAGVIDTTFGVNGYATPGIVGSCYSVMSGVNNVLYVGCFDDDANDGKVVSYDCNGIINTGFGTNGTATLSDITYGIIALASAQNGNIMVAGYTAPVGPDPNYGLVQEIVEYTPSTLGISGSQYMPVLTDNVYVITPTKVYATSVVLPSSATRATRTILSGL